MGLFGALRTSVSGMNAQSNRMGAVAENIANTSTTGYKRAGAEFETLVGYNGVAQFASGGVNTVFRHMISEQGTMQRTTSVTDLSVQGEGFFVVQDNNGTTFLTRAGNFVPDSQGRLTNAAGFILLGYDLAEFPDGVPANGVGSLKPITINQPSLVAAPSTEGLITFNVNSDAAIVPAANLPSANAATATPTSKTSVVAYDNLGHRVVLDIHLSKTATGVWEAAVFNQADASPGGAFPYAAGPLAVQALTFDMTNGALIAPADGLLSVPIPDGQTLTLDLGRSTQLAADFTITQMTLNGNEPSSIEKIQISENGTVSTIYRDGSIVGLSRIPLATVISPDNLSIVSGNAFWVGPDSGSIVLGDPDDGPRGRIMSASLESSTVDLGNELTTMIEAQRSYTANSKVFQAGSELLEVLMNLKV